MIDSQVCLDFDDIENIDKYSSLYFMGYYSRVIDLTFSGSYLGFITKTHRDNYVLFSSEHLKVKYNQ